MRKNLFYSVLFLLFIFTGCSQKDVQVDTAEDTTNQSSQQSSDQGVSSESNLDKIDSVDQSESEQSTQTTGEVKENSFEPVLFGFDKFNLTPEMLKVARENSAKINALGNVAVKLEGNCDEWGSDEYNYALGLKRAKTVKDVLISDGFSSDNISMVSFGESNPVCKDHHESCWAQNRRVEYKVKQ